MAGTEQAWRARPATDESFVCSCALETSAVGWRHVGQQCGKRSPATWPRKPPWADKRGGIRADGLEQTTKNWLALCIGGFGAHLLCCTFIGHYLQALNVKGNPLSSGFLLCAQMRGRDGVLIGGDWPGNARCSRGACRRAEWIDHLKTIWRRSAGCGAALGRKP